ncbi:hypothetical protein [Rhodopirellula bahusiensis]|uniref:GYF domain-containing protein n=1 Tax=Rhodopirellula bahusiensis TaxID=2014065 RepID=A0A2G1VXI5_9BACT|nr:hypothetical protein [Rhodopirellula bahusiensis]PHQ31488.1 hypothetical protein CEE69_30780 [Rhodopirellula bahusiensis]
MSDANKSVEDKWLIKTIEGDFGPVSRSKLQRLAGKGKIHRETPIRRPDDATYVRAELVVVFETTTSEAVSTPTPTEEKPAKPSLSKGLQSVAGVAADGSRLTKLKVVALPKADRAIGRKAIEDGLVGKDNPYVQTILQLRSDLAKLEETKETSDSETLKEKALRLGTEAKVKVSAEATRQKIAKQYSLLGASLRQDPNKSSNPSIATEVTAAAAIGDEIDRLQGSLDARPKDKKRAMIAAAVVIVAALWWFSGSGTGTISTAWNSLPLGADNGEIDEVERATGLVADDFQERSDLIAKQERERQAAAEAEKQRQEEERERQAILAEQKRLAEEKAKQERKERLEREEAERKRQAIEAERERIEGLQERIRTATENPEHLVLVKKVPADKTSRDFEKVLVDSRTWETIAPVYFPQQDIRPIKHSALFFSPGGDDEKTIGTVRRYGKIWNPILDTQERLPFDDGSVTISWDNRRAFRIQDGDLFRASLDWNQETVVLGDQITEVGVFDRLEFVKWVRNVLTFRNPSNDKKPIVQVDLSTNEVLELPASPIENESTTLQLTDTLMVEINPKEIRFTELDTGEARAIPNYELFSHPAVSNNAPSRALPILESLSEPLRDTDRPVKWIDNRKTAVIGNDVFLAVTHGHRLLAVHLPTLRTKTLFCGLGPSNPTRDNFGEELWIAKVFGSKVVCAVTIGKHWQSVSKSVFSDPKSGSKDFVIVDISTDSTKLLPKFASTATWINDNAFLYVVKSGGISEVGLHLYFIDRAISRRISTQTEEPAIVMLQDGKTALMNLDGWKKVDTSTGSVEDIDVLATAVDVMRLGNPIDLGVDQNPLAAWNTSLSPTRFRVSQSDISFPELAFETDEQVLSDYNGAVRETLDFAIKRRAGLCDILNTRKYADLVAPVIEEMVSEGKEARLLQDMRFETPVRDKLASCVEESKVQIWIYETCWNAGAIIPDWMSDSQIEEASIRTAKRLMSNPKTRTGLCASLILGSTRHRTGANVLVYQTFAAESKKLQGRP